MAGPAAAAEDAAFDAAAVIEIVEGLRGLEGPLLPILHAVNDRLGHVDARAVPLIAEILNLSRAEVHGVVGFYHDFRRAPAGRHRVQVCRAEACQAMGGEALVQQLERRFGIPCGQTTADRQVTLEAVYCLGNCALSPAAMVDGALVGRADGERIAAAIAGRAP